MANLNLKKSKKMQSLSFANVEEFLDYLPGDELEMVEKLLSLVYHAIPNVRENLHTMCRSSNEMQISVLYGRLRFPGEARLILLCDLVSPMAILSPIQ